MAKFWKNIHLGPEQVPSKTFYGLRPNLHHKNPYNIIFLDSLWYSIVTAFSDAQKGFPWHPTLVDNVFWNIWLATILRFLEKSSKKCYSSKGMQKKNFIYMIAKLFKNFFCLDFALKVRTGQCSKILLKSVIFQFWKSWTHNFSKRVWRIEKNMNAFICVLFLPFLEHYELLELDFVNLSEWLLK